MEVVVGKVLELSWKLHHMEDSSIQIKDTVHTRNTLFQQTDEWPSPQTIPVGTLRRGQLCPVLFGEHINSSGKIQQRKDKGCQQIAGRSNLEYARPIDAHDEANKHKGFERPLLIGCGWAALFEYRSIVTSC